MLLFFLFFLELVVRPCLQSSSSLSLPTRNPFSTPVTLYHAALHLQARRCSSAAASWPVGLALGIFPNVASALMEVMKVCHQAVVDLRSPGVKKKNNKKKRRGG